METDDKVASIRACGHLACEESEDEAVARIALESRGFALIRVCEQEHAGGVPDYRSTEGQHAFEVKRASSPVVAQNLAAEARRRERREQECLQAHGPHCDAPNCNAGLIPHRFEGAKRAWLVWVSLHKSRRPTTQQVLISLVTPIVQHMEACGKESLDDFENTCALWQCDDAYVLRLRANATLGYFNIRLQDDGMPTGFAMNTGGSYNLDPNRYVVEARAVLVRQGQRIRRSFEGEAEGITRHVVIHTATDGARPGWVPGESFLARRGGVEGWRPRAGLELPEGIDRAWVVMCAVLWEWAGDRWEVFDTPRP